MSIKVVFNNTTNQPMNVWVGGHNNQHAGTPWGVVSGRGPGDVISGTVSGATNYYALASTLTSGVKLTTQKFTGDTEVTLAVFTMPLNPSS